MLRDAVPDGILRQRLEAKSGNCAVEHARIDSQIEPEPLSEAPLLDADVVLQQLNLTPQRDLLDVQFVQRSTKQFAQTNEDVLSPVGIVVDQRRNRLERIE